MKHNLKSGSAIALMLMVVIGGCTQPDTAAESSPTASEVPQIADDLPADEVILQAVLSEVENSDLCDGFYDPAVAQADSQVYVVDNQAIVEIVCARAAYQLVYAYAAYEPNGVVQPIPLELFYPDETGEFIRSSEPTTGGLATFDPDQRTLSIFTKARGLGDCGAFAEYAWTGDDLALTSYRYQACDDTSETYIEPEDYPQIYP